MISAIDTQPPNAVAKSNSTQAVLQSTAVARRLLMGAECGCRRSNEIAPVGIAPPLARWWFEGRSLVFRKRLKIDLMVRHGSSR